MKVLITSGGGGHFTLAKAVAEEVKGEKILVSDRKRRELRFSKVYILPQIRTAAKPRINFLNATVNLLKSLLIVIKEKPAKIINTGTALGYFVCLFGKILGAKVIGVEPNDRLVPSKSIKMLEWFADEIWLPQKELKAYYKTKKAKVVGLKFPRSMFASKPVDLSKLGLDKQKKTLLVVLSTLRCGEDKKLADTVIGLLNSGKINVNLIMNTGQISPHWIKKKITNKKAKVYIKNYFNNFYGIAKACDLVIARAGVTAYEMLVLKKPTIIIPLENSADNHQMMTAKNFEIKKMAEVIYLVNEKTLLDKINKMIG